MAISQRLAALAQRDPQRVKKLLDSRPQIPGWQPSGGGQSRTSPARVSSPVRAMPAAVVTPQLPGSTRSNPGNRKAVDQALAVLGMPESAQGGVPSQVGALTQVDALTQESGDAAYSAIPAGDVATEAAAASEKYGSQYAGMAYKVAVETGIDPDVFMEMTKAESSFNPNAVSPVGAVGLTQFMPGTAERMGLKDRRDPEQNLRAGARLFKENLERFGTVEKALAAHNAGEGAVEKYGGVPPYEETQNFVARIKKGAAKAKSGRAKRTATSPSRGLSEERYPNLSKVSSRMEASKKVSKAGKFEKWASKPATSSVLGVLASEGGPLGSMASMMLQTAANQKIQRIGMPAEVPELTTLQKNVAAMGLQPGTAGYQQAMWKAIMRPSTQVNVGGNAEPTYAPSDPNFRGWLDKKQGTYMAEDPNTGGSVIKTVEGAPSNRPTPSEAERTASSRTLYDSYNNSLKLINDPNVDISGLSGKWKDIVSNKGFLNLTFNSFKKKLGAGALSEKENELLSNLYRIAVKEMQKMSGASYSEQQFADVARSLPSPGMSRTELDRLTRQRATELADFERSAAKRRGQTIPEFDDLFTYGEEPTGGGSADEGEFMRQLELLEDSSGGF